jgi:hypothetical protein
VLGCPKKTTLLVGVRIACELIANVTKSKPVMNPEIVVPSRAADSCPVRRRGQMG